MNEHERPKKFDKDKSKETSEDLERIMRRVEEMAEQLIEVRRDIHKHPELGFNEHRTARLIAERLNELGLEVEEGVGGTGVIGTLKGTEPGPTVAVRSDMDALKVQEPESEHASVNEGIMHACGHDAHVAATLGVAEVLANEKKDKGQKGDVLFIFQPNEERAVEEKSGAVAMIKHLIRTGRWDKIDAFFAHHVVAEMPRGTVRMKEGVVLAGSSRFNVQISGPGGHAARVDNVPNPVILGARAISEISKEYGGSEPNTSQEGIVVNPTFIASGDTTSSNTIPPYGSFGGSIRITKVEDGNYNDLRKNIHNSLRAIVSEVVDPWRDGHIDGRVTFTSGTRPVIHRDAQMVKEAKEVCREVIPDVRFREDVIPYGEDFSFFVEPVKGRTIPGIYFGIGAANLEKGIPESQHHSPSFRIDEDVIPEATTILSYSVLRHLNKEK